MKYLILIIDSDVSAERKFLAETGDYFYGKMKSKYL